MTLRQIQQKHYSNQQEKAQQKQKALWIPLGCIHCSCDSCVIPVSSILDCSFSNTATATRNLPSVYHCQKCVFSSIFLLIMRLWFSLLIYAVDAKETSPQKAQIVYYAEYECLWHRNTDLVAPCSMFPCGNNLLKFCLGKEQKKAQSKAIFKIHQKRHQAEWLW